MIFEYGKCYEDFVGTIKYDTGSISKITIAGDMLYIFENYTHNILVYNRNTKSLCEVSTNPNDVIKINNTIEQCLQKKNCSCYNPNKKILENFWHEDDNYNIIAVSDKYIFEYNQGIYIPHPYNEEIKIYNRNFRLVNENPYKKTEYIGSIKDIFERKYYKYSYYSSSKNIIVYDNILYVIGRITQRKEHNISGGTYWNYVDDFYIHLYNASTFKFIREFGKTTHTHHDDYSRYHSPLCMAFADDKIYVCKSDNEIEIWNNCESSTPVYKNLISTKRKFY
jgi:hypothetical protein